MKVISNTSPLIALACLHKLNILKELFTEILIPKTVLSEAEYFIEDIREISK